MEHCRCICLLFFLVFPQWAIWFIQIDVHKLIKLFWLTDLCKGKTRRFMMDKPRLTSEVDGRMKNAYLKNFILFRKLRAVPSEHIFEYKLLSFGLIVFKYSCVSFCLVSPLRTFYWTCFLAWSFNSLKNSSKVQNKS